MAEPKERVSPEASWRQTPEQRVPPAPEGLQAGGLMLWREWCNKFQMPPAELMYLEQWARCKDFLAELTETIEREGPTYTTPTGQLKMHPAVLERRKQQELFGRMLAHFDRLEALANAEAAGARRPGRPAQRRGGYRGSYGLRVVNGGAAS